MDQTENIATITEMVQQLISNQSYFITNLFIKPTNNIKVFIDGEEAVSIDWISKLNRALYKKLEESGMYPDGNFSLEVSSPGVDEPLIDPRQYKKHIGRKLQIVDNNDQETIGKLASITESGVSLEMIINKKTKETELKDFSFKDIKRAVVQISFK